MKQKISAVIMLMLVGISVFAIGSAAGSALEAPSQANTDGTHYQSRVHNGTTSQVRFHQRTQFQLKSNNSADVDIECDGDKVGNMDIRIEVNSTQQLLLKINTTTDANEFGLETAILAHTRNQNRIQNRKQVALNISTNASIHAKLGVDIAEAGSTWAFYNESTGEFQKVDSWIKDGILYCNTDHFSIWTVLNTSEEESTASSIDGYTTMGLFVGIAAIAMIMLKKR